MMYLTHPCSLCSLFIARRPYTNNVIINRREHRERGEEQEKTLFSPTYVVIKVL